MQEGGIQNIARAGFLGKKKKKKKFKIILIANFKKTKTI